MTKYITLGPLMPVGDEDDQLYNRRYFEPKSIVIYEPDQRTIDTGLLNKQGDKLYRIEDKIIGFK